MEAGFFFAARRAAGRFLRFGRLPRCRPIGPIIGFETTSAPYQQRIINAGNDARIPRSLKYPYVYTGSISSVTTLAMKKRSARICGWNRHSTRLSTTNSVR